MKKFTSFLAGVLTSALLISLPVSALASSGKLTLEVAPIQIQVNGEAFRPVDVNGNAVMVFTYNGTTYAPLRALAEAYGLEVGYDAARNMATVGQPLSDQWSVSELLVTHYGNERVSRLTYSGPLSWSAFQSLRTPRLSRPRWNRPRRTSRKVPPTPASPRISTTATTASAPSWPAAASMAPISVRPGRS